MSLGHSIKLMNNGLSSKLSFKIQTFEDVEMKSSGEDDQNYGMVDDQDEKVAELYHRGCPIALAEYYEPKLDRI